VDLIRSGNVPDVILRKGATGELPLPAEDKIEVLAFLAAGPDELLSVLAGNTLQAWDSAELRRVMANPRTAPDVLRFGAERLAAGHEDFRDVLLWNPSLPIDSHIRLQHTIVVKPPVVAATPEPPIEPQPEPFDLTAVPEAAEDAPVDPAPEFASLAGEAVAPRAEPVLMPEPLPAPVAEVQPERMPLAAPEPVSVAEPVAEEAAVEILAKLASGAKIEEVAGTAIEAPPEVTKRDDELTQKDRETLIEKVNRMSVVEKIKAALTGNMETRVLLIRDSNKIISRAVLQSPKISDTEAESYAAAKNVSEEVLRLIAQNRKFMKTYSVMRALINNPRAPIDITMPLLPRVNERDLKGLSLNRNVPEVIRSLAIKMMKQREDAGKVKLPGKH
jgi:hypothetical protein